ncbi:MAG: hypothetical protein ACHQ1D_00225 [Nitrososphaerales archaeon]
MAEQITRIRKYLPTGIKDTLEISVVDNSTDESERRNNYDVCYDLGVSYYEDSFKDGDPSINHSQALNYLYWLSFCHNNDFTLFLDHDTFMFSPSNIIEESKEKHFAGIGQSKLGKMYMHPNCLLINNNLVPREIVNLAPCEGMDTGGMLANYISTLRADQINHLSFQYADYSYDGIKDKYEIIGESFAHLIKGSNWNRNPKHKERQDSFLYLLQKISI